MLIVLWQSSDNSETKNLVLPIMLVLLVHLLLPLCNGLPPQPHRPHQPRIIGGTQVLPGELPYQLSLRYLGLHHCGASLLQVESTQLAITAAHCVSRFNAQDISLVAGETQLSVRSGFEQERQVGKIVSHERFTYNISLLSYDIALLFFEPPFLVNDYVRPIGLPAQNQETTGNLIVSGWGVYNEDGYISDNLTRLEIPLVDYRTCAQSYSGLISEFQPHFICAGFTGEGVGKDSCRGDSGGPLRSKERGYLAGVISWGAGCGHPSYPGVNMKTSFFTNWIVDQTRRRRDDDKEQEDESDEDNKS